MNPQAASMLRICGGLILGTLAWNWSNSAALILALLMPLLVMKSSSRTAAGLTALAYYLGAAWDLPQGAAVFFGDNLGTGLVNTASGYALWFGASLALSLPWWALWTHHPQWRGLRMLIALGLVALPPIGLVGWAWPLTATGLVLPGFGWLGLGLMAFWLVFLASMPASKQAMSALLAALSFFIFLPVAMTHRPNPAPLWQGQDTQLGWDSGSLYWLTMYEHTQVLKTAASTLKPHHNLLLPETVGGEWHAVQPLWRNEAARLGEQHSSVIVGVRQTYAQGYDNCLAAIGAHQGIVYCQRVPVPISMWQPWNQSTSVHPHWFGQPVFRLGNQTIAPLICYEQLLVWPVLQSFAQHQPDLILAPGNSWWSKHTRLPQIQINSVHAWGRLFGVPVVTAMNY
ncbi:MAG: conjugal transfer protein TraB [Halothiobacillaceae bacterium]